MREKYDYLGAEKDRWYESNYVHVDSSLGCDTVCDHDIPPMIQRQSRSPDLEESVVHYGIIASSTNW
jgi:hypothetical protein